MQQIVIALFAPWLVHPDRPVLPENDVAPEYILAVSIPDMWMERIVDHHIVFHGSEKAFAKLDSAVQGEVVIDVIVGGAIVEINVPAVVATPAVVTNDAGFD